MYNSGTVLKQIMVAVLLVGVSKAGFGDVSDFTLSTGAEYSSGDYDGDTAVEELYVPVTASFITNSVGFSLTVPYLSVKAPAGTVIDDAQGQAVVGEGPKSTESGLGDIIGQVTYYDFFVSPSRDVVVDLNAKIKFGTADEKKGLGTGENDYSVQTNVYKYFDTFYLTGVLGYKFRGDLGSLSLDNVWFGSVGATFQYNAKTRRGFAYYYRESSFEGGDAAQELTGFISHRLNQSWRLQFYALAGFSESSPDWGGGMLIKYYL